MISRKLAHMDYKNAWPWSIAQDGPSLPKYKLSSMTRAQREKPAIAIVKRTHAILADRCTQEFATSNEFK